MKYSELKSHLKELAKQIKDLKGKRKGSRDGYVSGLGRAKYEFRHHHIAYCELRGREREQIEKPADDNLPNEHYIKSIKEKIVFPKREEATDGTEAVCNSAE